MHSNTTQYENLDRISLYNFTLKGMIVQTKRHRENAASISLWPQSQALFLTGGEEHLTDNNKYLNKASQYYLQA